MKNLLNKYTLEKIEELQNPAKGLRKWAKVNHDYFRKWYNYNKERCPYKYIRQYLKQKRKVRFNSLFSKVKEKKFIFVPNMYQYDNFAVFIANAVNYYIHYTPTWVRSLPLSTKEDFVIVYKPKKRRNRPNVIYSWDYKRGYLCSKGHTFLPTWSHYNYKNQKVYCYCGSQVIDFDAAYKGFKKEFTSKTPEYYSLKK